MGALLFGLSAWPGMLDQSAAVNATTPTGHPTIAAPSPVSADGRGKVTPNPLTSAAAVPRSGTDVAPPATASLDRRSVAADVAALGVPAPGETLDVLVRLNVAADATPAMVQVAAAQLNEQLARAGVDRAGVVVHGAGVVSLQADATVLDQLAASTVVAAVEPDQWLAPALARSTVQVGAPQAWQAGFNGAGRSVAVIDSGVEGNHPALLGKVVYEACFTNGSCPNGAATMVGSGAALPCQWGTGCEHGTHVAGIIAAGSAPATPTTPAPTPTTPAPTPTAPTVSAPAVGTPTVSTPVLGNPTAEPERRGVAPGAGLVALQVFSQSTSTGCAPAPTCPRARTSDVLLALDHVLLLTTTNALPQPIVAVNLSLASDVTLVSCNESILAAAIDRLWAAGVATVVAAGNSASTTQLSIPACVTSSVSVGALDQTGNPWSVSNASTSLDFFAPGVGVVSTWPGARWQASSGTSTAAPHVAGAWAVASQALRSQDPAIIDSWLRRQPTPLTVGGASVARLSIAALALLVPPASSTASPSHPWGPLTAPLTAPLTGGLPVPGPRTQPDVVAISGLTPALSAPAGSTSASSIPDRRIRAPLRPRP